MRRRSFLKLIALGSAAASLPGAALAASRPAVAATAGRDTVDAAAPSRRLYRARGGRVYVSADVGRSWQLHSNLGPDYDVRNVSTDGAGGAHLVVAHGGRTFDLALGPDLRSWWTV